MANYCVACGRPLDPEAKFCPHCGAAVAARATGGGLQVAQVAFLASALVVGAIAATLFVSLGSTRRDVTDSLILQPTQSPPTLPTAAPTQLRSAADASLPALTPSETRPATGELTMDVKFGGSFRQHVVGHTPIILPTICNFSSAAGSPSTRFLSFVDVTSDRIRSEGTWEFSFSDDDGPGRRTGTATIEYAIGFDEYSAVWAPGAPTLGSGKVTYQRDFHGIEFEIVLEDAFDGKDVSASGSLSCSS